MTNGLGYTLSTSLRAGEQPRDIAYRGIFGLRDGSTPAIKCGAIAPVRLRPGRDSSAHAAPRGAASPMERREARSVAAGILASIWRLPISPKVLEHYRAGSGTNRRPFRTRYRHPTHPDRSPRRLPRPRPSDVHPSGVPGNVQRVEAWKAAKQRWGSGTRTLESGNPPAHGDPWSELRSRRRSPSGSPTA